MSETRDKIEALVHKIASLTAQGLLPEAKTREAFENLMLDRFPHEDVPGEDESWASLRIDFAQEAVYDSDSPFTQIGYDDVFVIEKDPSFFELYRKELKEKRHE